jgi:sugar phosphate isomerase/epimerase
VRAPLHTENLLSFARYAELAAELGASAIAIECALDAIHLAAADRAVEAVHSLERACERSSIALETMPLEAGPTRFDRYPSARTIRPDTHAAK